MESRKFEELTRALAAGASRRSVLRGLVAGGGMVLIGATATTAKPGNGKRKAYGRNKVYVCHRTDEGTYQYKPVPRPALKGHTKHGDDVCESDNVCETFTGCNPDGTCASTPVADDTVVEGGVCCGGVVVDTQTDPANCGGCGIPCDDEANPVCTAGVCGPAPTV